MLIADSTLDPQEFSNLAIKRLTRLSHQLSSLQQTTGEKCGLTAPLLTEIVQPRLCEILRTHHDPEATIGVEIEKPGFRHRRKVGRFLKIHY